jgi:uncharacterized protein (TIGR03032 family)
MQKPDSPFALQVTPGLPSLLRELELSLLVSTYQAGKVIVVSADGERLVQLPRTFDTPMGLALEGDRLAIATAEEIVVLASDSRLGVSYPKKPGVYDAFFVPRSIHFCGRLMVHDLAWTPDGLIGVNTGFSCLFRLDEQSSFVPCWQPGFISELLPEDRCHLNGLALDAGRPAYLTALAETDEAHGWRTAPAPSGVLIEAETGEVVLRGLDTPHSPRLVDGRLYLLLSGTGEVVSAEPETGHIETIARIGGFLRGMACVGEYLFVASSQSREKSPLANRVPPLLAPFCGVTVLHLGTGAIAGELRYLRSCEEIYDVQLMRGMRRPGLQGLGDPTHRLALSTPERSFWAVAADAASSRESS